MMEFVEQHVAPAFEARVAPVAINALNGCNAEGSGFVRMTLTYLGEMLSASMKHGQFQVSINQTSFFCGFFLLVVHIELARDHAVVNFAAAGRFLAEMPLKIRVGRDGVQPGPRRKAPDLAQRGGQRSGLGGVAQALAVGAGWSARWRRGSGRNARTSATSNRQRSPTPASLALARASSTAAGVDVKAEALERGVRAGGGDGFLPLLLPGGLRDKAELFGRKAAAQAGRDVERFLRRFNDKRARTAERVLHERVAPHAAKVRDGGGQRFLDGRERGVAAVAALVQTVAGGCRASSRRYFCAAQSAACIRGRFRAESRYGGRPSAA